VSACSVCALESVEEVDAALVAGTPYRTVAARYGVSKDALVRHKKAHLSDALVPLTGTVVSSDGALVSDRMEALLKNVEGVLNGALLSGKGTLSVSAAREARMGLELLAKLRGELNERPQVVNIVASPDWIATRSALFDALAPYPDARLAVAQRLLEREAS
jgi:hypothetical protein